MRALWACALALTLTSLSAAAAEQGDPGEQLIVESVRCQGNTTSSCDLIASHLYLHPGDALDEEEIQNATLRLTSLRSFESADIHLEKGSQRGRVQVVIEVQEVEPITAEWGTGTSARAHGVNQWFGARVSHQNAFGTGKFVDATVSGRVPIEDPVVRAVRVSVRYADPRLFDSSRYFAIANLHYENGYAEDIYGSFADVEQAALNVSIGRRLWDFSFLEIAYGYRFVQDIRTGRWQRDGTFELKDYPNRHLINVLYGWNSEDDFYFPTRGSSFHIGFGYAASGLSDEAERDAESWLNLQFRKTWQTRQGTLWTLKIGGEPTTEYRESFNESQLLSVAYSSPIASDGRFAGLKRGRWYVEPGVSCCAYRPDRSEFGEVGLKVGMRLEIETLGLIDLYIIGTTEWTNRGPQQ